MEKESKAKNAWVVTPCGPSDPCGDYDGCESGDDISEKDFATLLNEERDKFEAENEKNEQIELESKATKTQKEKKEKDSSEDDRKVKKKPCRKVTKNPFYTNRLTFSSDLPPRPPVPPPQFLPLAGEDENKAKVCPKRKKKCKKKKGNTCDDADKHCEEEEEFDENEGEEEEACGAESCDCRCDENPECCKPKRRCNRHSRAEKVDRPPCRKKASDNSIPPQPRRIPLLLKDLPSICPKDIPEVERQILMSRENDSRRSSCKKKCRKKDKVVELLNQ